MRIDMVFRVIRYAVLLITASFGLSAFAQPSIDDFMIAVANGRADRVLSLLGQGIDPNVVDANGDAALTVAAREGNAGTVNVLLAAGAKANVRNRFADTPMMVAALNGHVDIVKALRTRGALIDAPGWTPLIYAATGGHDDVVRYLLAEGANVDARSPNGTSALMMAVREGHPSTVALLIANH